MKIYVTTHYIALLCHAEPFVFAQGMLAANLWCHAADLSAGLQCRLPCAD